jgi:hypothetical protein
VISLFIAEADVAPKLSAEALFARVLFTKYSVTSSINEYPHGDLFHQIFACIMNDVCHIICIPPLRN